jgi:hypothetical protein
MSPLPWGGPAPFETTRTARATESAGETYPLLRSDSGRRKDSQRSMGGSAHGEGGTGPAAVLRVNSSGTERVGQNDDATGLCVFTG